MDIHAFLLLISIINGQEKWDPKKPKPVVVEVLHDVIVSTETGALAMKKGQRFDTIADRGEGGCRIRFQKKTYEVNECYWMGGFRDTHETTFKIIPRVVPPSARK
jgi:hypothetical protein